MKCDEIRQFLPDHALGTLSETESATLRSHLRGCSSCRAEAAELDQGVALFAQAAHAAEPPSELRERVLAVLQEEWSETLAPAQRTRRRFALGWQAIAALLIVLAGVATWGGIAQGNASRFREDALSYRNFLGALGGKDVRVGRIVPNAGLTLDGNVVMYDSDHGQSWVLVLARAPGFADKVTVSLEGSGRSFKVPFPLAFDPDGEGWTGLVTAANLSGFDRVVLTDSRGNIIGTARIVGEL